MKSTRILAFLLAVLMVCTLCACGREPGDNGPTPSKEEATTTTTVENTTTTTEVTTTTTTTAAVTEVPTSTEATDAPTKAPTQAPTTTTTRRKGPVTAYFPSVTTTEPTTAQKTIRILAVGNSFSVDAMKHHLYPMLQAAGYDNILLGILYVGGCSIDSHYSYIKADSPSYDFQFNGTGSWSYISACAASRAFNQTDWDIVTVQQASPDSGKADSFGKLNDLLSLIKTKCRGAKVMWHMTWAYQQDSTHDAFPRYDNDQMTMYKAIVNATISKVAYNESIRGIIPCGTAIQNLRTSSLGDTLTADGYHLKDTYGDYTAALTWYCMLTGKKASTMSYRPASIADHFDEIAQAVDNAILNPYEVTPCN